MNLAARVPMAELADDGVCSTRLHGDFVPPRRSRLLGTMSSAEYLADEVATDAGRYAPIVSWLTELEGGADEPTIRLSCPVRFDVTIDPDDEGFIAYMPFLASVGTGATYDDALRDLAESIRDLKAELESAPVEALAPDAVRIRARLAHLLG